MEGMDFLQESAVCFFLFCFFSGLDASGMRIISPVQESIWSRSTGFPRKRASLQEAHEPHFDSSYGRKIRNNLWDRK